MWFKQEHHNHKNTYPVQVLTKHTQRWEKWEAPVGSCVWIFAPQLVDCLGRIREGVFLLEEVCHWRRVLRIQKTRAIPNVLSLPDSWGRKLLAVPSVQ